MTTLKLNYTDKHRVWDGLSAPTNHNELADLIQSVVSNRTDLQHTDRKMNTRVHVLRPSRKETAVTIQIPLRITTNEVRSVSIYFDFDRQGVQRWKACYFQQSVVIRTIDETRRSKFYGKLHLHAIIDSVLAHDPYSTVN